MAGPNSLINFDVIESQKENIQSLPGGRSAKKLMDLYSPQQQQLSAHGKLAPTLTPTPNLGDTKTLHERTRAEFEAEVASLSEADDPLDVYDRYVAWTLDAFPSAQATRQSQLHTLLERATRAFVGAAQYRNDPRYLRLWLHYIHFFSDAPRETFVYLARHSIGDALALFYEEYAVWLESAGRWAQADEVYRLGIDRGARPQPRLLRKYTEFEQRRAVQDPEAGIDADAAAATTPHSPALPMVRPALAAKVDPFASAAAADAAAADPQQQQRQQQQQAQRQAARAPAKSKMAIFSDADASAQAPALGSAIASSKGWEGIASLAERKKENVVAAKPWAGEKLSAGGKKPVTKMPVFRDASLAKSHITIHPSQYQVTVNPQSGKKERVFVDLCAVYPTPEVPGSELSFEEVWAANRGLVHVDWAAQRALQAQCQQRQAGTERAGCPPPLPLPEVDILADAVLTKLVVHKDMAAFDENGAVVKNASCAARPRKKRAIEVNETQIIKAKLDSPSGGKILKRRGSVSEPTMTMHTRAATDDIYEIFNRPLPTAAADDGDDASEDDYETTDGGYTSGAESADGTRHISASEAGDDEDAVDAVSEAVGSSDIAARAEGEGEQQQEKEKEEVDGDAEADANANAIEDANASTRPENEASIEQDVLVTLSSTAADDSIDDDADEVDETDEAMSPLPVHVLSYHLNGVAHAGFGTCGDDNASPLLPLSPLISPLRSPEKATCDTDELPFPQPIRTRTIFIPIPPEDYVAPTRPYRDAAEVANSRLPFMTPITERTESSLEFSSENNRRALHAKTPSKPGGGVSAMAAVLSSPEEEDDEDENVVDEYDQDELDQSDSIAQRQGRCTGTAAPLEPMSSPLLAVVDEDDALASLRPLASLKLSEPALVPTTAPAAAAGRASKGPIIQDAQCNPIDESLRLQILASVQPALTAYTGFFDHRDQRYDKGGEIRRYAKAVAKSKAAAGGGNNNSNSNSGIGIGSNSGNNNNSSGGFDGSGSGGSGNAGLPVLVELPDGPYSRFAVRRELGAGAFAPVYLVENLQAAAEAKQTDKDHKDDRDDVLPGLGVAQMGHGAFAAVHDRRHALEALKMETPPTAWEFYMMRTAHTRLGPHHRATASLAPALACHLYRDETFLFLPFYPHGTLLDVVNLFRAEPSGVMDEALAMFFAIELFRTVEALHSKQVLHGDIKADNCLLRLDDDSPSCSGEEGGSIISSSRNSTSRSSISSGSHLSSQSLSSQWQADGSGGWSGRGLTLIDFGRGIDMRAFAPDVRFVADWKTTAQDCAEMREGRPWTWQIDYHGLAGVLHCLLFGKYMETMRVPGDPGSLSSLGGAGAGQRRYRLRESLKRYWQTDIWSAAFDLLLNPVAFATTAAGAAAEDGGHMPVLRSMRAVRERMETWLAANCERGVGLKSLMIKVEGWARARAKKM